MMSTMPDWKSRIAKLWSDSPKVAEWRLPFALFACAILAYAAAYAWHMLASFDLVNIIRDVNYDDSFYYFQIAYNLSQGKFSTFDGGITQTNGYQPVWMLLITPLYWIFDKETALFGIKAFEIMLVAGGVALIAAAAWLARLAWLLLVAALPTLYRNPHELLLGLEAAAAMFALALLILAVCLYMRRPERWKWALASIAFALPWVRIEYIAISLAVTVALCAIEWSRQERRSLRLSELANIRHAYIPLIGAIAGMLVYFAYNGIVFGGILPVSAVTKLAWMQNRWAEEGGYNLAQNFWDTLAQRGGVFDHALLIAFEICAYLLLAWWLALRSNDRRDWLLLAFMVGVFGVAAGHIAKFAQSVLTMHPNAAPAYELWYFVPAYIMEALIIPIRLYIAIYLIRRFIARRWSVAANALNACVVVISAALLLGTADFAQPFRWVDKKSGQLHLDWELHSYMGAQVINRALPEGSVIGSWDAGVIGYFSHFPVVNLDGVVNSYDYFHAQHKRRLLSEKTPPRRMEGPNFYRRYGATHFANANYELYSYSPYENLIFEIVRNEFVKDELMFMIWTYDPPLSDKNKVDHSHWVWDNMKPRFDQLSDGVGVVMSGRLAQAFAKDCVPNTPMVWTFIDEQKHERALIEPSLNLTSANMCIAQRILSRGEIDQPAQVRITPMKAYFADLKASRAPIIRSDFDVYISGGSLIYAKPQCGEADVEGRFFANTYPAETDDLPAHLRQRGYETIDFDFNDYGIVDADGKCWAALSLPNYPVAEIHAGQYAELADGYIPIWEATHRFNE